MLGHHPSEKCQRYCANCLMYGHTMQFCRKIKNCVPCGKKGHNPHNCWEYKTWMLWLERTDLKLCLECLTTSVEGDSRCRHCQETYIHWSSYAHDLQQKTNSKETRTEDNDSIDQEKQEEMQNTKTIMENLKQQTKDLEDKLQQQVSTNEQLNAQLQDTSDEKEQVLQQLKGAKLKIDLVEAELVNARAKIENLKAEIYQKDLQLEQSYQKVAQSLLITSNNISEGVTPETVFQGQVEETIRLSTPNSPCLTQAMAFNNFENKK